MKARIGQLWRLARYRAGAPSGPGVWAIRDDASAPDGPTGPTSSADVTVGQAAAGEGALPPEQPVLLLPSGTRAVRVGELLPVQRRRWPLSVVRLPAVPKRAILAAGVVAGLAGPTLARHLVTRALLGGAATRADGVLEITRIVYTGPLTPRATAAIAKAILATRR
jgi:hypothetical protein